MQILPCQIAGESSEITNFIDCFFFCSLLFILVLYNQHQAFCRYNFPSFHHKHRNIPHVDGRAHIDSHLHARAHDDHAHSHRLHHGHGRFLLCDNVRVRSHRLNYRYGRFHLRDDDHVRSPDCYVHVNFLKHAVFCSFSSLLTFTVILL